MSCDRNLTAEEWLEIVHGFWQVGREPGFGPSGWISRLNVTITNVCFLCRFCSLLHLNVLTGQWLDIRSSGPWSIGGFYTLPGLMTGQSVGISSNGPWRIDSVPWSQGVDKISMVDHQELVNLVQMLFQCISYFEWVLCIWYLALCILCGFGPKPLG